MSRIIVPGPRSIAPSANGRAAESTSATRRFAQWRRALAALLLPAALTACATAANAQGIVQEYYVPMPEAQIRTSFLTLAPATGATMDSVISVVVAVAGTQVVYDHWEDGYEPDLNNPVQASTRIWGDGNNANGIPPGFANDPASFSYGTVLALRNLVSLPRNAATILYDGRDRVGATRGIVMSRSAWATTPGSVLADATEVQSTIDWGTSYVMPIGENVLQPSPLTASMFELTSMMVMASLNNTQVQIDKDGNGTVDVTVTINQGESYQVTNGVMRGATVTATKPVQVQLLTGDIGANYESRWFTIPSVDQWTPTYYAPVGTAANGEDTYLFLYNNNAAAITINYTTQTGSGSFSIPAKSTYTFKAPQNSGTKFVSAGGQDFYGVGAVGAAPTSNNVHDWGFDLVPSENLTTEMVVGWGPGSSDLTQNGSPVWVTPVAATTIYVDYNGDHAGAFTDPAGGKYDLAITSAALQVTRVFEADRDQTGMRLYTLDGTLITGAWGQDPATAGPGVPYLDAGTTVPNFPVPTMSKTSALVTDVAPAGLSIGDTIEYTITLNNQGLVAIGNTVVLDTLPASLTYVPNTTTRDAITVPDSGVTPFPLDETGITVPILPRRSSTVLVFRAVIAAAGSIVNTASSSTGAVSTNVTVVSPGVTNQCVIDFTTNAGATVSARTPGDPVYVTVTDNDANSSSSTAQSFAVVVTNTTGGDVETITLTETGVNTGVFRNTAALPTSSSTGLSPNDGTLRIVAGDTLAVTYVDPSYGDTCNDSLGVNVAAATKVLYLDTDGSDGDTAGDLDRVDPVASSDATTSNTSTLSAPVAGTVAVDGSLTNGAGDSVTSFTWSHTSGTGTNRLLLVGVSMECNGGSCGGGPNATVSSVTWGADSLTRVGRAFGSSRDAEVEIWALFNPVANTTRTITVTNSGTAMDMVGGATNFSNVNQSQTLSFTGASGASNAPSVTVTSATGSMVFDTVSLDDNGSLSVGPGQTSRWNRTVNTGTGDNVIVGGGSTEPGAASVTMSWSYSISTDWAIGAVSIAPAASGGGGTATFTQTPSLCEALTLPAGAVVGAEAYFSTISGTMPATPSVTAELKYGSTTVATSSSAASDGSKLTFTFPALGAATTIPSGSQLQLVLTNNQSGVTFQVQYDSSTKPSFVSIPTTTVIHLDSIAAYTAAYSGGTAVTAANNGQTLYVRTVVGDPFGAYDITSLPLTIDGPGVAGDVSTTLTDSSLVASTSCQKTYEYAWATPIGEGVYTITGTAKEGLENTVADSKSTNVTLTQLDLGTPCSHQFTDGSNGAATTTYAANQSVCARISDLDQNTNTGVAETVSATISSSAGDSEAVTLTETGANTGVFVGCVPASASVAGSNNNGTLYAPLGTSLSTTYTDPNDSADICSATGVVPSGSPAVQVTKTLLAPTDGQARIGETVQYRLHVTNSGNTTLATVALTDTFPAANLTYVSASPSPNTVGAGSLAWTNVGPLVSGASVDVIVNFTAAAVPASNPVVNSATADAGGGVTSTSTANVTVTNPALSVSKTLVSPNPGPAGKGTNVNWSITVQNTGNTTIDTLPFEDTYSGACFTFGTATPSPDGSGFGSIVWTDLTGAGSLAPGASTTVSVTLQASGACNPATNTASADFVTDTFGDAVPPATSSATIVTQAAEISGTVYEDAGATGFGGDLPLSGVSVTLYTDPNGDGDPADGTVVEVQTTLVDGSYSFSNLGLGHYVVVESDPIGYHSHDDTEGADTDNRIAVNVTAFTAYTGNDFLDSFLDVSTYGSISGQVREDVDGDGNLADPDSGLSGVQVALYTDPNGDGDPSDGVLFLVTATTGSGAYSFPSVPPGNYVVAEINPPGYNSTADAAGANDDLIPVVLGASATVTARDFLDTTLNLADLSITKSDGVATYTPGGSLTYTITATNTGPGAVTGATVTDTFPAQLTGTTWTCSSGGGASCPASGSGNLSALVNLPVFGTVTFTVSTQVVAGASADPLTNTATIAPPSGTVDNTAGNNSASDSDSPTAASATIGDRLWLDEDGDGVQDAGEEGLAGITVRLYDSTGVTLIASATTGVDGSYLFTGVAAGNYVVRVDATTLPAGLAANPTYDLDGGVATPNGESAVTVIAGQSLETADFGYNWVAPATSTAPAAAATGMIGDRLWNDADGDGLQDAGESGIAGVTVRLLVDSNGDGLYGGVGDLAPVTTTTSASGHYAFDGIAAGAYVLQVDTATLPAGFTTTPTGDPDSDGDNTSLPIVIAPGDVFVNGDFGYTRPTGRTIGDTIFLDRDADGSLDGGEPGIPGVTVTLLSGGNVVASTVTDASGQYFFPGLADGSYTVVVTDTAGILLDTPVNTADPDAGTARQSTVVVSGANNLAQDFGFVPSGHGTGDGLIGDTIFLDRDASGSAGAGEGLEGVTVRLFDSTGTTLVATAVTDANGQYVFGGLDASATYQVRVDTTTLPGGGAGLTNSADPDGGTASRAQVNLSALGGTTVAQDFGYTASTPNTISGTLWNDLDADGTQDAGETGRHAGVTIVLRDALGNVVATTTTNASGAYAFSGLPDGTYSVDVADGSAALAGLWKSTGTSPGADGNSQADAYTVTVTGGVTNSTGDFGYHADGASLGNYVWADTNNDGIQQVTESGLSGALVTLTITYPNGAVSTVTAVTGASGAYSFGNLLLDESFDGVGGGEPTYSISVATPSGHQASPVGAGGNPLLDSNNPAGSAATPTKGVTSAVDDTLASNGYDFGFTPLADLSISKVGPGGVKAGNTITYSVVVTNNGPGSALAVVVADPTPSGLLFVSNTGDCGTAYPCSLGTIAAGDTRTITTTYNVPLGYTSPDPIVNTATVSSSTVDPVPGNNSSSASTSLTAFSADLGVVKTGPVSAVPGNNVTYTIVVTNHGPDPATSISLGDSTPVGLTFVSNTGDCTTAFPCSFASLAVGASRTVTSTYSIPASYAGPSPFHNLATVSGAEDDPVSGNNTSTAAVLVSPSANLAVSKTAPASITPGATAVFTVQVTNLGPSDAAAVTVTDPTPAGLTFVSNAGDCTGAYPCALGTVAAGATRTITSTYSVPASYTAPNPVENTATVASTTSDPVPGNNSSTASSPLSPSADLSISKDDGTAVYVPGGSLTYTITATNAGPSSVTGATVTDLFPAQLSHVTWTCSGAAGGSCPASGAGNLSAAVNLPVGGSVTFLVSADVNAGATVNPLVNTATVSSAVMDPVPGNNSDSDSDAPAAAAGSIGDRLWVDEDGDGVADTDEDGIAGVTMQLYDGTGNVLLATTVTDTDGRYVFRGLAAGDYIVHVDTDTMPPGLATNYPTYDLDGGTATPDGEAPITLAAGQNVEDADFGYNLVSAADFATPVAGAPGAIGDRIWNDADGDGVQDAGEAGIAGVQVRLLVDDNGDGLYGGPGDSPAVTRTTDASGAYYFSGIAPGAYVVEVNTTTLPAGFTTTPTGDPEGDGDSRSAPHVIAPGDVHLDVDFGYRLPTGSSIGSTLFVDANADGTLDAGEPGIGNVTVMLLDGSGAVVASTITGADGSYLFPGLPDGSYTVVVSDVDLVLETTPVNTADPDGGSDRRAAVTLAGADNLAQDFGFTPTGHAAGDGMIGDLVFLDRDGGGTFDAGEALEGVIVSLYDATGATLIASTRTGHDGHYYFGSLDPSGTYQVRIDTTSLPSSGVGLVNNVDPDGGTASRSTVDLSGYAGGIAVDQDFGFAASTPNTIAGTVWNDVDADGSMDAGETAGYAGVVVTLRDSNGDVVATTTTDASGDYLFEGLPDGTYTTSLSPFGYALTGLWKTNGAAPGADGNSQADPYTVTVAGGVTDSTGDFGFSTGESALGNRVFEDLDGDGIQDAGEPGLAGVAVTLTITYSTGDVITMVDVTGATGAYSFPNLLIDEHLDGSGPGQPTFVLTATTPAQYQPSPVGAGGNPLLDSNDPAGTTATAVKGLSDTADDALSISGYDFGFAPQSDVTVVKTGPASIVPGTNAVYTITVTNNGPRSAAGVTVTDPTPSGLTFVSNTGSCVTAFPCSLGTIASGGSRTITATYAVPGGYTTPDPVVNTATVSSTTTDTDPGNNTSTASTGLATTQADLSLTKTGPVSATPGLTVAYTIVVTNSGPATATGTTVTDPTPAGLTFVSNAGDCTTAFPCALGSIASGGTRTITATYSVPASYSGANPLLNTATVSAAQSDPTPGNNSDTESTPVVRSADVSIAKSGPASTGPGSSVSFTVSVTNSGPSDATGVVVADPTPAGLTFVSNTGACATAYPCNLGSVAAGQTRTITSTYAVPAGYAGANPIVNTATVSTTSPDPDSGDHSATASVPVISADLMVVKSDSGASVNRGDLVTYTISVFNNGPSLATSVTAVDTLDSATTYISDTGGCTQAPLGTLTCPVGALGSGDSASFTVTVRVGPSAPFAGSLENGTCNGTEDLCNVVTVTSAQADPDPSNNIDREPTDVTTVDLEVVKSDSATGTTRLSDMAYTITVTNNGPATATNVVALDTLDPNTTYVSDTTGCTEAPAGVLTCPVGTIAPGDSTSFQITVQVGATAPTSGARENGDCNGAEDLCNEVVVSATQADSNPSNNRDDEPTNVMGTNSLADLTITKTDLTGQVAAGSFSTYELTVTNAGPNLAREAVVVDTLDPNMDFISSTQGCTEGPVGTLTCPVGDMAIGATATFSVVVHVNPSAPTAGTFSGASCPGTQDLCNRASVSSMASDPIPSNNAAEVSTDAVAATQVSELSLVKSDLGAEPVLPGGNVTYQIVVTNSGPNNATDVVVHESLDPSMTYVSDTAGCTQVSGVGGMQLDCPLGTVPAGSSTTMQIVVTIAADAPVSSVTQDGDCNDAEDVCNHASVSTSSSDFNIVDNSDSEPTDISASLTCNNGAVDGTETCDPVSGEICNNGVDDDGNGQVDCADASCQAPGFQSCDGNCQLTPVCLPILDDPASVKWDSLNMHGRWIPTTPADPNVDGFTFVLSNEFGEIYHAELLPGDMRVRTKNGLSKWVFKDPSAKKNGGIRGGLFRVGVHQRVEDDGQISYVTTVRAYGDMTAATVPTMTTLLYIGDDVAFLTVDWEGKPGAWHLSLANAIAGQ